MPVLKVQTNLEIADKRKFMEDATALLSRVLGKPSQYIMVIVDANADMMFAGSNEPLAYLELKSIGLPKNKTSGISAELCNFIEGEIQVPQNRIYIEFANAERDMFGWNGSTF
jgi:phenylpyruvate tautomerase PptA (4-oxalocrotonate tautomerase family)